MSEESIIVKGPIFKKNFEQILIQEKIRRKPTKASPEFRVPFNTGYLIIPKE